MKEYIALFEYVEGEQGVGVVFPDLPGCVSSGKDFDEAFKSAHEALSLYAENEKSLPEPRTLEDIREQWQDWEEWDTTLTFVIGKVAYYSLKPKTRKFNISIDERLVQHIDKITNNRSAFIVEAIEQKLRSH
jgi:predicted RNase H-like HicB family nuclease